MPDAQISLTGRLGDAPELRFTPDGVPVCSASVAVNKTRKIANTGDPKQDFETIHTTWYRVTWWREIAEAVAQMNLEKGQAISVAGEVYMEEYQAKDGTTGKALNVTAMGVRPFPKRQGGPRVNPADDPGASQGAPAADPWAGGGNQGGYDPDQVPF